MNVSDSVRMSDLVEKLKTLKGVSDETKDILGEIIKRFDVFAQGIVLQLKNEPTIFSVNPSDNPETVEGAKTGDLAVWVDGGVTYINMFQE